MSRRVLMSLAAFLFGFAPTAASACACGCGVFDVGTGTMLPTDEGGSVWFEYDFLNQDESRHGGNRAAEADNEDRQILSHFFTAGAQYMFDRSWGASVAVPYTYRHVTSADEDSGDLMRFGHGNLGDIRVQGIYSGFSEDMSTGVTFGFKLPTGDFRYGNFGRDTSIGTGSTNLLLGAYHMGALTDGGDVNWFTRVLWDRPVMTQGGYRPGTETNASLGVYYNAGYVEGIGKFSPLLQFIGTWRLRDSGPNAESDNTGYHRLLIAPGIEFDTGRVKLYGDVEVPIYQYVNGHQLAAPVQFKFMAAYDF